MSPMTRNTFIFGTLMILLAIGFFIATGMVEKTALIPGAFGVLLLICGGIALKGESARKHAMHVAAMIGLIGVLTVGMAIAKIAKGAFNIAAVEMLIFSGLSLVFLILCIKSFIDARKAREYAAAKVAPTE